MSAPQVLGRNQVGNIKHVCGLDRHVVTDGELSHENAVAAQFVDNKAALFVAWLKRFSVFDDVTNFQRRAP